MIEDESLPEEQTMISVITVTYNSEDTIGRTMDSLVGQSSHQVEHLIMDGGSTDKTLDIVERYRDVYERCGMVLRVFSEKDRGPYDAMNKGIRLAAGELVGILNSDDYYDPCAIETVEKMQSENDFDILMGAIRIHNGSSQIITKHAKNTHYQTSRHFNHPAMFVTKQCYREVGEYELGNVHADYGWYLKAVKMGGKILITDEVLTDFVIGGWSSRKSFRNTLDRISTKYAVYRENGYSRFYWFECVAQEMGKFLLLKSD